MVLALLESDLKTYIVEATGTWHAQHKFSDERCDIAFGWHIQSVSWSLAEFRHNKIVQSPHENYFNLCR